MSTLGIGARVWIGWCPPDNVSALAPETRLKVGTILDGPHDPGTVPVLRDHGGLAVNHYRSWTVMPDGVEQALVVSESLLFPIDDDEGRIETKEEREVVA